MTHTPQPRTVLNFTQSALELVAKITALAATLSIALSVMFDWGYLSAVGLRLSEVPTSLSDHTRSAILWMPVSAFIFPLSLVVSRFLDQRFPLNSVEAKNQGDNSPTSSANETKHARRGLALTAVVCFATWLLFGDRASPFLFFAAAALWALIVMRVTPISDRDKAYGIGLRMALLLPAICLGSLFSMGYNTGHAAITPDQPLGMLDVHVGSATERIKGNIVRSFERFIIVLDGSRKIVLLKPEDVRRVEKPSYMSRNEGLLCQHLQLMCPRPPSHTP
jgi:hypothetical protein